tara:strand:- start:7312 stop:7650 length:339 start_codon:yes stop_codon:yes gene_type:complete
MMDVDVEIYCKNFKNFFVNNPTSKDELLASVPGVTFESFMEKVTEKAYNNFEKLGDPSVTRKQILDILNDLYVEFVKENYKEFGEEVGLINNVSVDESKVFQNLKGFNIGLN